MQLTEIQSRLFDVGSNIATPEATSGEKKLQRVRCVILIKLAEVGITGLMIA